MNSSADRNGGGGAHQPQPTHPAHAGANKDSMSVETMMNLALLDPPRWGWAAVGGIADLLPPHERARRGETKALYLQRKSKKRQRTDSCLSKSKHSTSLSRKKAAPTAGTAVAIPSEKVLHTDTTPSSTSELNEEGKNQSTSSCSLSTGDVVVVVESGISNDDKKDCTMNDVPVETGMVSEKSDRSESESHSHLPLLKNPADTSESSSSVKSDSKSTTVDAETSEKIDTPEQGKFQVKAYDKDGNLDLYAYHRGIEGLEPRDEQTGELLSDVPPTDTNYHWDGPQLSTTITINFPLHDVNDSNVQQQSQYPDAADAEFSAKRNKNNRMNLRRRTLQSQKSLLPNVPMFSQNIIWDLGDPNTQTPILFATNLAQEFGLSFGQTIDIALSIENQLSDFIRENSAFAPPVALKDPNGNERPFLGAGGTSTAQTQQTPPCATFAHLYGEVLQIQPGGTAIPIRNSRGRSIAGSSRQQQTSVYSARNQSTKRKEASSSANQQPSARAKPVMIEVRPDEPELEEEWRVELLARMRAFSNADIQQKWEDKETRYGSCAGTIEIKSQYVCHICHKKADTCGLFACRMSSHSYCKNHLAVRLGIPVKGNSDRPILDICPICALTCECSKCRRRVEGLSYELRRLAKEEQGGATPKATVFEGLFTANHTKQQKLVIKQQQPQTTQPAYVPPPVYTGGTTTKRQRNSEDVSNGEVILSELPTRKKNHNNNEENHVQIVEKLVSSEFPREVREGIDLDPACAADYLTQYKPLNSYLKPTEIRDDGLENGESALPFAASSPLQMATARSNYSSGVVEDGNVDFCHTCGEHGNLLCCDFCPRAFHKNCIKGHDNQLSSANTSNNQTSSSESFWECHVCCQEKDGLPDDFVDGKEMLKEICVAFHDVMVEDSQEHINNLKLLSIIHGMIIRLVQYDFGYMFRNPVDCDKVVGYRESIKNPMDLGTIGSNIINGKYKTHFMKNKSWNDVIVAVLKDIELVWHNCFTFNYEGSAIYRMAEVQRRRTINIRRCSFEDILSDSVRHQLAKFVRACERQRGVVNPVTSVSSNMMMNRDVRPDGRIKARHKISINSSKKGCCRPVGVLDPDTGFLVKIYSTIKSATQAAEFLKGLGHACELSTLHEHTVKNMISKSKDDPSLLLFGYRWLPLDELKKGVVRCSSSNTSGDEPLAEGVTGGATGAASSQNQSAIVEMVDGQGGCYIFLSLDEATSFPGLDTTNDLSIEELRTTLEELTPGDEYFESPSGIKWRLISPSTAKLHGMVKNIGNKNFVSEISLCDTWKFEKHPTALGKQNVTLLDNAGDNLPSNLLFAKEDLVVRRRLVVFETIEGAFRDWLQTCESSPVYPENESKTMDHFRSYYLNGDRNVDGIIWKTEERRSVSHPGSLEQKMAASPSESRDSRKEPSTSTTTVVSVGNTTHRSNAIAESVEETLNAPAAVGSVQRQKNDCQIIVKDKDPPGEDSTSLNQTLLPSVQGMDCDKSDGATNNLLHAEVPFFSGNGGPSVRNPEVDSQPRVDGFPVALPETNSNVRNAFCAEEVGATAGSARITNGVKRGMNEDEMYNSSKTTATVS